ncbi:MAG TPA: helix-turn-helix domain-containing protein [Candidatus Paceibacterota bacterium]
MNEILEQLGLGKDEIAVFDYLLSRGEVGAGDVIRHTQIKRGTCYNILDDLVARNFAKVQEVEGLKKFSPEHPSLIAAALEKKREAVDESLASFQTLVPNLVSRYNTSVGKPAVRALEGLAGLEKIYEDIINEGADILLIRSIYDDDKPELDKRVQKQIARQVERGIKTRALTPMPEDSGVSLAHITAHDEERLVTRHFVPRDKFALPAQVIIYADRVAITDLKDNMMISTLVRNNAIAETMRQLFEYLWLKSDPNNL